ncbi:MAG TPA: hypothetical protein VG755_37780 [Nannocystaceae bacterium]|nr:hypothetical protein [Nannocystaceae bacterium]
MRALLLVCSISASGCATNVCIVHERVRGPDVPFGMDIERRFAADGRPLAVDERNSVFHARSRYRYDARRRLVELHRDGDEREWSVDYRYDDAGRLVQASRRERGRDVRSVEYRYDDAHLIGVVHQADRWELSWQGECLARAAHFARDADRPSMLHEYVCDRDRIAEDAFTADFLAHRWRYLFTFDDAGRISARHLVQERDDIAATPALAQVFHYDGDRLRAIEVGPATDGILASEFRYDAEGRVVARTRHGTESLLGYGERCTPTAVRSLQPTVPPRLTAPWWSGGDEWEVLPFTSPRSHADASCTSDRAACRSSTAARATTCASCGRRRMR